MKFYTCIRMMFLVAVILLSATASIAKETNLDLSQYTDEIVVTFKTGSLISEPSHVKGTLTITGPSGTSVVIKDRVNSIRPLYKRGTKAFHIEGPWIVTLIGAKDVGSIVATKRSHPSVAKMIVSDFEDIKLIGEHTKTEFPPQTQSAFCGSHPGAEDPNPNSQVYMHLRTADEAPFPGDWCDRQGAEGQFDHDMDLPQAWAITKGAYSPEWVAATGDTNVLVAVADVGLNWTHPAFGGPGPVTTVTDSLLYYNQGVVFRNWTETPGDANSDGAPGVLGVDDDGDGLIDEDSIGLEPGNLPESDVLRGIADSAGFYTIVDNEANWTPGTLVGRFVRLYEEDWSYPGSSPQGPWEEIEWNSTTEIRTNGNNILDLVLSYNPDFSGWAFHILEDPDPDVWYQISDFNDNDGDGLIDDLGYLNDLDDDDDENGYIDDFRGWDFVDSDYYPSEGLPKEDFQYEDNDTRSFHVHGDATSSQIATSSLSKMRSIAPDAKLLPLRCGYGLADPINGTIGQGTIKSNLLPKAVAYAAEMGADIISTSISGSNDVLNAAVQEATSNHNVIHTNGASNWGETTTSWDPDLNGSMIVAGLNRFDHPWVDTYNDMSTGHGPWVDLSAIGDNITIAATYYQSDPAVQNRYQYLWDGTSLSGPIVAGVAALVKSAYPHWTNIEIQNKILSSTDDIYQYDASGNSSWNPGYEGELGSGRINAYKALSFYGPIGTAQSDTTWTGDVWVSGDIIIPEGVTLNVAAGCTIHVAQDDITQSGLSPNVIEFDVSGTLSMLGTSSDPITIEGFFVEGADHQWGPLVFTGSSTTSNGIFHHVDFLDGGVVVKKGTNPASDRINLDFQNCSFVNVDNGIYLEGLALGDRLNVSGCDFSGKGLTSLYGIYLSASSSVAEYQVTIDGNTTIDDFYFGVLGYNCNSNFTVSNSTITDCEVGVLSVKFDTVAGPEIGPDLQIVSPNQHGLNISGGPATIQGVTITGAQNVGMVLNNASPIFQSPATLITGSMTHAVEINGCVFNTSLAHLDIQNNYGNGIRVVNSDVEISSSVILDSNGGTNIYCDNSAVSLVMVNLKDSNISVLATNSSAVKMRRCSIGATGAGVLADATSTIDCGTVLDGGYNMFISSPTYYAANFNTVTMSLVGNCFDGSTKPSPVKFLGTVNYNSGYCR